MKASFVIVNYNRKDELLLTIEKTKELISGCQDDYEIIVVDNASSDGSAAAVTRSFRDVVLIEIKVHTGAPAWNLGFARAQGDYLIIIDDDSHILSGLKEALQYMDLNPDTGVLALNVISGPYTSDMWEWKDGEETIGFIGCGAILRRETYKRVGGYGEWMFLYVNEWEYGLRCIDAGYKVRFFENCRVEHRASKSHRSSKRLRVMITKHELGIVYKYFSNRKKNLLTVAVNNLKIWRFSGPKDIWYNILGIMSFLKMRKSLSYTPVSDKSQQLFAEKFYSLSPAFAFFGRGIHKLGRKAKGLIASKQTGVAGR